MARQREPTWTLFVEKIQGNRVPIALKKGELLVCHKICKREWSPIYQLTIRSLVSKLVKTYL